MRWQLRTGGKQISTNSLWRVIVQSEAYVVQSLPDTRRDAIADVCYHWCLTPQDRKLRSVQLMYFPHRRQSWSFNKFVSHSSAWNNMIRSLVGTPSVSVCNIGSRLVLAGSRIHVSRRWMHTVGSNTVFRIPKRPKTCDQQDQILAASRLVLYHLTHHDQLFTSTLTGEHARCLHVTSIWHVSCYLMLRSTVV